MLAEPVRMATTAVPAAASGIAPLMTSEPRRAMAPTVAAPASVAESRSVRARAPARRACSCSAARAICS